MVAHGMSLQDARREIKKLYELDAFDKKERAKYKRQRQQEEEVKKHAKNMITSRAGGEAPSKNLRAEAWAFKFSAVPQKAQDSRPLWSIFLTYIELFQD